MAPKSLPLDLEGVLAKHASSQDGGKTSAKRALKDMELELTEANVALYQTLKASHLRVSRKLMLEHQDEMVGASGIEDESLVLAQQQT